MSIKAGTLYIVATPIGNSGDFSARAIETLNLADLVYAEDTRRSARLFAEHGISTRLVSMHEHNEEGRVEQILGQLGEGLAIAVISDAGTPLISDPGYQLVSRCHASAYPVSPVPGPSSLIAALSVSGLPTDSFVFLGFPPAKAVSRLSWLERAATEQHTVVILESRHRIVDSLADMGQTFGGDRLATIARELTKTYETVLHGDLNSLSAAITNDEDQQKGEFVVLIAGVKNKPASSETELVRVLTILLRDHSVSQSAQLAAELTGHRKKEAYALALKLEKP